MTEPDAFDEKGNVKPERIKINKWVAFPSPHTKWDKLELPAGLTLKGLVDHFAAQGLTLDTWAAKTSNVYDRKAFAPDPEVDYELLQRVAPYDLGSLQKAMMALMP